MVITRQIVALHSAKRTFRMFIAEALCQTAFSDQSEKVFDLAD